MKKTFLFLVSAIFILAMSANLFAQTSHEMYLSAPNKVTYINQIIMGDTTASGARKDTERVYVLQRGGIWFFNDVIKNIGWDVRIRAENGSGPKPIIYGSVADNSNTVPIDFIDSQGSVYLKNICVNGITDIDTNYTRWQHQAPRELVVWNVSGNYTLVVDSCILMQAYQADLRTFSGIRSIIVTNTIFANDGTGTLDNMGDGRAVDLRKTSCDSLVMVNNTFVNGEDRLVRHISSVANLNYFRFDHNTVVNNGGRYGVIALGLMGSGTKVQITNNLFLDPMTFGADTSSKRQYDFLEDGEPYSATILDKANQVMIYHQRDTSASSVDNTLQFNISNNDYAFTKAITDIWDTLLQYNPVLHMPAPLSNFIQSKVSSNAFTKVAPFSFANVPHTMEAMVYWNLSPLPTGAGENSSGGTEFRDFDRRQTTYFRDTLDCSYSTSLPEYTAGIGGYPLGDLNWFPNKHAAWEGTTGIRNIGSTVPVKYSLDQNYPNPFNPTTVIRFSIPKVSRVSLIVYNVLGQKVATLINEQLSTGVHEVDFNAASLSSGVYFYSLSAGSYTITKKMLLLK